MPENLLDHLGPLPFDEQDDLYRGAALGTAEQIDFVNLVDQLPESLDGPQHARHGVGPSTDRPGGA